MFRKVLATYLHRLNYKSIQIPRMFLELVKNAFRIRFMIHTLLTLDCRLSSKTKVFNYWLESARLDIGIYIFQQLIHFDNLGKGFFKFAIRFLF